MERIPFRDMPIGAVMITQMILGALGNFTHLSHYLSLYHREGRVRITDFILMHLTVSNSLVIVSQGASETMAALGLKHFLNSLGCALIFYVHRLGRCMSIGSTYLLSVFQAITISPMDSCWKDLRVKAAQYVTSSVSRCWVLYAFVNLFFPMYIFHVSIEWSTRNTTDKRDLGYCYTTQFKKVSGPVYSAFIVLPEVLLSVLIVWASGSMISFLYKHRKRVQHLHRNKVSSRPSVESRATHRILVLVSSFICFHTISSLLNMCVALFTDETGWFFYTANIISLCFPCLSPFILMRYDLTAVKISFALIKNRKSHGHTLI